jgi:hypothetical protein
LEKKSLRALIRKLAPECDLFDYWAIFTSDWNGRNPYYERYEYDLEGFLAPVNAQAKLSPRLLSGRDIMDKFSLVPGIELGEILKKLDAAFDEGLVESRQEALDYVSKLL